MSRRISQPFRCRSIEQLARQLLFAPPDKRIEQVARTEKLHDQIEPGVAYPFEFISYRITGYRSEADEESLLVGEAILPDLRLLIDVLSRSCDMEPPSGDPIETPEQFAARLNVGPRTVTRWRMMGLRWRWAAPLKGHKHRRLVITRSASDRFVAQNKDRVERAARFSQIDPKTRGKLIERARRIAQAKNVSLNQVATHLAQRTGRAVETIRLILQNHDARNPEHQIFIDRTGPLTARQKRVIVRAHRMEVRTMKIARHFKRTRTTIFRVLTRHRAAAVRRHDIRFVASPMFSRDDADEVILRPLANEENHAARHAPAADNPALLHDLPPVLRPLFTSPALDPESQRSILVRYNYLKFKAHQLQDRLDRHEPRVADLEQIDAWLHRAIATRHDFAAASQRIVLSVARRHLIGQTDASPNTLLDLLDVGQEVLLEAIESFDATKDHEFESYLTWALMRRFASDHAGRPKAHRRPDAQALAKRIAVTGLATLDALEEKLEAMEAD